MCEANMSYEEVLEEGHGFLQVIPDGWAFYSSGTGNWVLAVWQKGWADKDRETWYLMIGPEFPRFVLLPADAPPPKAGKRLEKIPARFALSHCVFEHVH